MAFDLVQYFVEQIETQKPELLKEYTKEERRKYISEINALTLGKLITEWRHNPQKIPGNRPSPDYPSGKPVNFTKTRAGTAHV